MHGEAEDRTIEQLEAHAGFARGLARSLLRDDHAAEDVVQEALMVALEQPPVRNPRAWLATVTRRLSLNRLRSAKRRDAREQSVVAARPPDALPPDLVARRDTLRSVMDAVLGLPEPYQGVVLLRFFEDLAPTEIAARLGIPAPTVRTRLRRALAQLREQLDDGHDGDRRAWCLALLPIAGFAPASGPVREPAPAESMSSDAARTAAALGGALVGKKIIAAAVAALLLVLAGSVVVANRSDADDTSRESVAEADAARERSERRRTAAVTGSTAQETAAAERSAAAAPPVAAETQSLVSPGDAQIVGRVIQQATGAGVAGADIYLMSNRFAGRGFKDAEPHTKTDDQGRFACPGIAAGIYHLRARRAGFLDAFDVYVEATTRRSAPRELTMFVPRTLTGRLVVPPGLPASEARVSAEAPIDRPRCRLMWSRGTREADVAADGSFVIEGVPDADFDITAVLETGELHLRGYARAVRPRGGPVEIVLHDMRGPKTAVSVRFEAPDGRPISALTYCQTSSGWGSTMPRRRRTVQGATFEGAFYDSAGTIWVEPLSYIDADGEEHTVAPAPVALSGSLGTDKVATLQPPVVLEGSVTGPNGEPVAGVEIEVWPTWMEQRFWPTGTATSRADGTFRIRRLAPGALEMHVAPPSGFLVPPVTRTRPGTPPVITLQRGAQPVLTVLGPDGDPVEDAEVELYDRSATADPDSDPSERDPDHDGRTDEQGRARIGHLSPSGHYTLLVHPNTEGLARHLTLDWTPADTTVQLPTGGSARGVVLDTEGRPVRRAFVTLRMGDGLLAEEAQTGADGTYEFEDLPRGSAALTVRLTRHAPEAAAYTIELNASKPPLDLRVDTGVTLRGTVANWGERWYLRGHGVRFIEDGPAPRREYFGELDRGRFWIPGLPPAITGTVLIGIAPGGFHAIRHDVRSDAGNLPLELVRGRAIRGTVSVPDGVSQFVTRCEVWAEMFGVRIARSQLLGRHFEILGLPTGEVTLNGRLRIGEREYRGTTVVAPGEPVELVLRAVE